MSTFPKFQDYLEAKKDEEDGKGLATLKSPLLKSAEKPKVRVAEKDKTTALGDEATPSLKNPKTNHPLGEKPDYSGLTTEQFVQRTANLSDSEFICEMLSETKKDDEDSEDNIPAMHCQYTGKAVMPASFEVAKYMAHMIPHNDRAVRMFVHELKKKPNGLSVLINELSGHNETYDEMVNQMGVSESKVPRRLVKAMHDNHNKFMTEMGLMTQNESVDAPMDNRLAKVGLPPKSLAMPPAPDHGDMNGTPPIEPPASPSLISDMPGDGNSAVGLTNSLPNGAVDNTKPETQGMKLNKEFAYHHMIREMSKFDNMANVMKEVLGA